MKLRPLVRSSMTPPPRYCQKMGNAFTNPFAPRFLSRSQGLSDTYPGRVPGVITSYGKVPADDFFFFLAVPAELYEGLYPVQNVRMDYQQLTTMTSDPAADTNSPSEHHWTFHSTFLISAAVRDRWLLLR